SSASPVTGSATLPSTGASSVGAPTSASALPFPAADSTSDLVILPAGPLPATPVRSTPSTAAARSATGVAGGERRSGATGAAGEGPACGGALAGSEGVSATAAAGRASSAAAGGGVACEASSAGGRSASVTAGGCWASGAGACCAAGAAPSRGGASPTASRAITCPTVTVSPSSIRISVTVPLRGEGSSMSTLSVEISTIVSLALMKSPTFTCHSRIVPSLTDSPAAGVTTSMICSAVVPVAIGLLL